MDNNNLEDLDRINTDLVQQEKMINTKSNNNTKQKVVKLDPAKMESTQSYNRIEIDRSIFGYGGKYYPASWRFFHKTLSLRDIRRFSSVDESKPLLLSNAMDDLVTSTLVIMSYDANGQETYIQPSELYEHDRISYILQLQRDTKGNTDALKIDYKCSNPACKKDNTVIVSPEIIRFKDINSPFDKYTLIDGLIHVTMKNGTIYYCKPHTIATSKMIRLFLAERNNKNLDIEPMFIQLLHVLLYNVKHKDMNELHAKYVSFDDDQYSIFKAISENMMFTYLNSFEHECACRFRNDVVLSINRFTAIFDNNNVIDLFA